MIGGLMERVTIPQRLLHAGQEFEMHRALRVDEPVQIRPVVLSFGTRQQVVMASFGFDAITQDGEVIARSRTSVVVPLGEDAVIPS
jgi:hypothetical protein